VVRAGESSLTGACVVLEPLIAWFDAPARELLFEKYEARARPAPCDDR
jgi:hypothetical protein